MYKNVEIAKNKYLLGPFPHVPYQKYPEPPAALAAPAQAPLPLAPMSTFCTNCTDLANLRQNSHFGVAPHDCRTTLECFTASSTQVTAYLTQAQSPVYPWGMRDAANPWDGPHSLYPTAALAGWHTLLCHSPNLTHG